MGSLKITPFSVTGSLKTFFGLPEEVFSGKVEFTDERRSTIASIIKEEFGNVPKVKRRPKLKKAVLTSAGSDKKPEKVKKEKAVKTKKVKPEGRKFKVSSKLVVTRATRAGKSRKEKVAVKVAAPKASRDLDAVIKHLAYSAKLIKLADALDKLAC